jgi:hypothetical protein
LLNKSYGDFYYRRKNYPETAGPCGREIPENEASINLHKEHGFRIIGTREKIGKMNGIWHDTILMERRSKIAGI